MCTSFSCRTRGLDRRADYSLLFSLAHGSSWRTEGCRRYLHGFKDRGKHGARPYNAGCAFIIL
jgi:hypothetical protein